jgi:hypothetical protein
MTIQPSTRVRSRTSPAASAGTPAPSGSTGRAPIGSSRVATTVGARSPSAQTNSNANDSGWMKSGATARAAAEQELQRQRESAERRANGLYMPFRFRLKVGEQREIIVLDQNIGPCFYEHNLQNPKNGKWDLFETCPKEWESCPICDGVAGGKESYYVMMLTCIDLTPWQKKDGTTVPYSKFLLPVKAQQQGFFTRQFDRHGSLRGLQLLMTRDTAQTVSIGNPEFLERHEEAALIESFGHEAVTGQDGKVIKAKNADCFPYPYAQLFKKPSGEDLRRRYGGMAPAGSRQEAEDEWASNDTAHTATGATGEAQFDDIPFDDADLDNQP